MAEADPLRKYVEAGIAFTQLTKAKAEAIVRELVRAGEVQREGAQDRVDELLDRSRKSTEGLVGVVRREIAAQLASLGLATQADLAELEQRLRRPAPAQPPTGGPGGRPAAARAAGAAGPAKSPAAKAPAARAAGAAGSAKAPRPAAKAPAAKAVAGAATASRSTKAPRAGSAGSARKS